MSSFKSCQIFHCLKGKVQVQSSKSDPNLPNILFSLVSQTRYLYSRLVYYLSCVHNLTFLSLDSYAHDTLLTSLPTPVTQQRSLCSSSLSILQGLVQLLNKIFDNTYCLYHLFCISLLPLLVIVFTWAMSYPPN